MGRSFVPPDLPLERLGELAGLVRPPVDRDRAGRGHSASRPMTQGRSLIGRLLPAIVATGNGEIRTETPLTGLIMEDGRVAGVEAGGLRMRASRGVLLATGGFEASASLRAERGVPGGAHWTMAPDGANTGDAIEAAVRVGASTGLLDQAWFCPGLLTPDGRPAFTLGFRGGLIVDGSGRRFANESLPYDRMGRRMAGALAPFHLIWDTRFDGLPAISVPPLRPDEQLASGAWVQAATLDELADRLGLPADALAVTVERFNGFAGKGADEDFHRGEDPYDRYFSGGRSCVVAVDRPPYFAAAVVLSDLGTKGGLRTDPDGRVLDGSDRPIPGLYAAGNTSASFTGPVYPGPGVPIGSAMAFAYRAVQHIST
ncbi:FAD-binding protein [Spirillospora sp. CA-142024]|uniref:FAD-binding protein n=1 Tax=Spirillospora sp. CA-142024 TaxID=3240036 RepID=UPI003D93C706